MPDRPRTNHYGETAVGRGAPRDDRPADRPGGARGLGGPAAPRPRASSAPVAWSRTTTPSRRAAPTGSPSTRASPAAPRAPRRPPCTSSRRSTSTTAGTATTSTRSERLAARRRRAAAAAAAGRVLQVLGRASRPRLHRPRGQLVVGRVAHLLEREPVRGDDVHALTPAPGGEQLRRPARSATALPHGEARTDERRAPSSGRTRPPAPSRRPGRRPDRRRGRDHANASSVRIVVAPGRGLQYDAKSWRPDQRPRRGVHRLDVERPRRCHRTCVAATAGRAGPASSQIRYV